jgi:hypothetical protein
MSITSKPEAVNLSEESDDDQTEGQCGVQCCGFRISLWILIPFVIILMIDVTSSVVIPNHMRQVNPDTRDLFECTRESGYVLFSNCCLTINKTCSEPGLLEHKLSTVSVVNYYMSVLLSLCLLGFQVWNQEDLSTRSFFKLDIVTLVFTIRNFTMFNMMNYVSERVGKAVVINAVKMELRTMVLTGGASLLMSSLIYVSFPTHRMFNLRVLPWTLKVPVFLSWLVLVSSVIYYIGATNVLGKHVLSLYDIRGPELLTLNYWNYGILLIIYSEYVLFTEVVLSWRKSIH